MIKKFFFIYLKFFSEINEIIKDKIITNIKINIFFLIVLSKWFIFQFSNQLKPLMYSVIAMFDCVFQDFDQASLDKDTLLAFNPELRLYQSTWSKQDIERG